MDKLRVCRLRLLAAQFPTKNRKISLAIFDNKVLPVGCLTHSHILFIREICVITSNKTSRKIIEALAGSEVELELFKSHLMGYHQRSKRKQAACRLLQNANGQKQ